MAKVKATLRSPIFSIKNLRRASLLVRPWVDKRVAIVVLTMPIVFLLLMTFSQLIPNSWVRQNIAKSREIIAVESEYHDAYYVPQVHWLAGSDGYTDDIFLRMQVADRSHGFFAGVMEPEYDRYWHGYSVFLRPLLVFFDLSYIRQLLVISFMVLMGILSFLVMKYISTVAGVLLVIAIALVNPPVIMISLQYSNMFLLTLAACIATMLMLIKKRSDTEFAMLFVVIGSLTSFLDLLTTPTITLSLPLLLYVAYHIQHKTKRSLFGPVVALTALWGTGYVFAWLAKLAIASLVLQRNVFLEASQKASHWSSNYSTLQSRDVTTAYVLKQWIKRLVIFWPVFFMMLPPFIIGIVNTLKHRRRINRYFVKNLCALALPSLLPLVWIYFVRQHSLEHQWFSYRHLVAGLFGSFLILRYLIVYPDGRALSVSVLVNKLRRVLVRPH